MVITIKEKKDLKPLAISIPTYFAPLESQPQQAAEEKTQNTTTTTTTTPTPAIIESKSLTSDSASDRSAQPASSISGSGSSVRSTTSVVRGFSPSHVSSSFRSMPLESAPSSIPTADIAAAHKKPSDSNLRTQDAADASKGLAKKQTFILGASSGEDSSEQPDSMDSNLQPNQQQQKKKAKFLFGGSSNEDENSLPQRMQQKSALTESIQRPLAAKKQTSFQEEVATRTIQDEQVFDDDVFETDEDDIDESAIDDEDDSSDWEDSVEDSGSASIDEKTFFQRVDSRPNLSSRRSLITALLHQGDRANALISEASKSTSALQRSRTSSPNGPSLAASPDSDAEPLMMKKGAKHGLKPIAEIPRSQAQPIIVTTTNTTPHQQALSPRTTRRNMLATELTVSLRQHLLWERQQKSQTANAVLKRRHTAHDVANLKQYPEKVHMDKEDKEGINASWNQYFSQGLGEYHSKGW